MLPALTPLVASAGLIAYAPHQQEQQRSHRQATLVRNACLDAARGESRHFTALGDGSDGQFFLHNFDGIHRMHPRQPDLVGRKRLKLRDENGQFPIQPMRELARTIGGFVTYSCNKPSAEQPAPRIAHVTPLDRWNWCFGTRL